MVAVRVRMLNIQPGEGCLFRKVTRRIHPVRIRTVTRFNIESYTLQEWHPHEVSVMEPSKKWRAGLHFY